MSPEPYRGKKNEPKNIKNIVDKICEIKGLESTFVCDVLVSNVCSLFDKQIDL